MDQQAINRAEALIVKLTAALQEAVRAFNVHPRFRVQETNSYAIAAQCDQALEAASEYSANHLTMCDATNIRLCE